MSTIPTPVQVQQSRLADRIKALIGVAGLEDLGRTAAELSVDERDLRRLVERRTRVWSADVLAALVLRYGIDPHWLISGVYDERTHREALDRADDGIQAMRRLIRTLMTPKGSPALREGEATKWLGRNSNEWPAFR